MPTVAQYPVLPSAIALNAASTMFLGVGRFMSPRWNGYTRFPLDAHDEHSADTANAVSLPSRDKCSANCTSGLLSSWIRKYEVHRRDAEIAEKRKRINHR